MTRPARFRESDLRAALAAIQDAGLHPKARDILPDGAIRWHFVEPGDSTGRRSIANWRRIGQA